MTQEARAEVAPPRKRRTDPERLCSFMYDLEFGPMLNSDQLALILCLTRDSLHSAVSTGRVPPCDRKIGNRVYWAKSTVDRVLEKRAERLEAVELRVAGQPVVQDANAPSPPDVGNSGTGGASL
ncbi:hypothetical protein [Streptomyces sp. URMC 123]|uniref:hypothetical protein n=1 Tax=Streptomyces sp. URMC 123 TaxID=3423403 RepID=UPI003F1DB0E7